jgi:hypothetical protein
MAISHELTSEIATALLTHKDRSSRELEELKKTLLLVYSTLQSLSDQARGDRVKPLAVAKSVAGGN